MSSFKCDLDLEAPSRLPDSQLSSIELARMFGCDEPEEPMEAPESHGLYEASLERRNGTNLSREMLVETELTPRIRVDEFSNAPEETKRVHAGDTVTLLRAASKQKLAKIWQPDGTIKPAACVKWFEGNEIAIASVEDICCVLGAVENKSMIALFNEALAPDADTSRLRCKTMPGTDGPTGERLKLGWS